MNKNYYLRIIKPRLIIVVLLICGSATGQGLASIYPRSTPSTLSQDRTETVNNPLKEISKVSDRNFITKREVPVTGKVTSEAGEPLPGVSVSVKGTTIGSITDANGTYSLNVPEGNATLVFSYVGMVTQEIALNGRSTVEVSLKADVETLQEVVVVGYGTVKRSDLTGSVSSISRKDVGNVAVANVGQMIQGRAAGVNVVSDNGLPGASNRIKIRGTGTIYNSDPLYIINGMPGDINAVSPYDIENIEILKDASSTAIYGARAANGVVLVTTKRGKKGEPTISYNGYHGITTRAKKLDLLNAEQYMDLLKDIQSNTGTTVYNPTPNISDPAYTGVTRTDWQDAIFRRGAITEHHINVNGGTDFVTYSVSTGYTNQDAAVGNYNYQRFNVMANTEFNYKNRIRFGENIALRWDKNSGNSPDLFQTLRMPPYATIADPTNLGGFTSVSSAQDINDSNNPFVGLFLVDRYKKETKINAQFYGEVDITKFLKFRSQFQYETSSGNEATYTQKNRNGNSVTAVDQLEQKYTVNVTPWLDNYLTFNQKFGVHELTAMVGNSWQNGGRGRDATYRSSNFESNQVQLSTFAASTTAQAADATRSAYLSYFGRLNYSLLNKYLVTFTIRTDGSPNFAPSNKWGTFPSLALAWKLHEEEFMKNIPLISTAKLRASWGKSGNDRIPGYGYYSNIFTGVGNNINYAYGIDDTNQSGATINTLPAPNIKWETASAVNLAIDLGLFENRLNFTAEVYNKLTSGILIQVPIPSSTGIDGSPYSNAASVSNKVIDLSVGYNGNVGDFSFNVAAVGGLYRNKVESLGQGNPIFNAGVNGSNSTVTKEGLPIGSFYGYKVDRILIDDEDAKTYRDKVGESMAQAGDVAFKDLNGDGKISEDDKDVIGNPNPNFNYGFNVSLRYKGFDLQSALFGVQGNQILNDIGTTQLRGMTRPFNSSTDVLNRWKNQGDRTNIPRATTANPNNNLRLSDRFIESGSYFRCRNITLGYRLPFENKIYKNLRVYFTAENVFTLTKYSGYDPEISGQYPEDARNANMRQGIDSGFIPQPKRYFLGVQLTF